MLIESLKKESVSIESFEKELGFELPNEYRVFLEKYNGAISKDSTSIHINKLNTNIEIDSLFGISTGKEWLDIAYWMKAYADEIPHSSIIVGYDLLRGFLVYICSGEEKGIYYWDAGFIFSESAEDSNAYYICKSFRDFENLIGGFILQ